MEREGEGEGAGKGEGQRDYYLIVCVLHGPWYKEGYRCVCVCVHVRVCDCMHACIRACDYLCMCACVDVWMCIRVMFVLLYVCVLKRSSISA